MEGIAHDFAFITVIIWKLEEQNYYLEIRRAELKNILR